jgi:hypothetical protein
MVLRIAATVTPLKWQRAGAISDRSSIYKVVTKARTRHYAVLFPIRRRSKAVSAKPGAPFFNLVCDGNQLR